jgi:signal transduction histidine kinase
VVGSVNADVWSVEITDTGSGISPEHLPHVFDRFYRVDPSRTEDSGGAGLGLAICRAIVVSLGGEISIESIVGEGTGVRVQIAGREEKGSSAR